MIFQDPFASLNPVRKCGRPSGPAPYRSITCVSIAPSRSQSTTSAGRKITCIGPESKAGRRRGTATTPRARTRALAGARRALAAGAARLPGARVEWKGLAVALHYRRVPAARRHAVRALVRELERRLPGLAVIPGNRVYDFVPRVGWDKGMAARFIARRARAELGGPPAVLYAGDDTTDEAAFRRLRRSGVTIRVGGGSTAAEFALRSVADVHALLGWLARALG